jgi:hypothetical protein
LTDFVCLYTLLRHTLIKKIFLTFLLTPYLYTFSLYEIPSLIIVSAEAEYISTRSWYRNIIFFKRSNKANLFLALVYILQSLDVKETTDTASSASFLDLYVKFDDWSTQYSGYSIRLFTYIANWDI